MLLRYIKLILLIFAFTNLIGQTSYQTFDKANSLYETKIYDSSKSLYLELYNNGMISKWKSIQYFVHLVFDVVQSLESKLSLNRNRGVDDLDE